MPPVIRCSRRPLRPASGVTQTALPLLVSYPQLSTIIARTAMGITSTAILSCYALAEGLSAPKHLYHYTTIGNAKEIINSARLCPSTRKSDIRLGVGVYFTSLEPWTPNSQLLPNNYGEGTKRKGHQAYVRVRRDNVPSAVQGVEDECDVWVVPGAQPLDLAATSAMLSYRWDGAWEFYFGDEEPEEEEDGEMLRSQTVKELRELWNFIGLGSTRNKPKAELVQGLRELTDDDLDVLTVASLKELWRHYQLGSPHNMRKADLIGGLVELFRGG